MLPKFQLKWDPPVCFYFSGIRSFEGMFTPQVKEGSEPYEAPFGYFAYAFQQHFKGRLETLQKQQIIILIGVEESLE